ESAAIANKANGTARIALGPGRRSSVSLLPNESVFGFGSAFGRNFADRRRFARGGNFSIAGHVGVGNFAGRGGVRSFDRHPGVRCAQVDVHLGRGVRFRLFGLTTERGGEKASGGKQTEGRTHRF